MSYLLNTVQKSGFLSPENDCKAVALGCWMVQDKKKKYLCQNWVSCGISVEILQARDVEILHSPYKHTSIGKRLLKFSCGWLRAGFRSFLLLWSLVESRHCLVEGESHPNFFQMCKTTQLQIWLTFLPLQLILIREKIPEGGKSSSRRNLRNSSELRLHFCLNICFQLPWTWQKRWV